MIKTIDTVSAALGFNPKGMHPGIINNIRVYPKQDTSKPYKSGKGKLAKHQANLGRRRSAHSDTLKSLSSAQNPLAYKTPGSMRQKCK